MNKQIIIGNVGKEPELKELKDDKKVATFTMASKEYGDNSEWFNIVAWGQLADVVSKYVSKGDKLYIEGRTTTRSYENKEGTTVYLKEVVAEKIELLTPKKDKEPQQSSNIPNTNDQSQPSGSDDLPF